MRSRDSCSGGRTWESVVGVAASTPDWRASLASVLDEDMAEDVTVVAGLADAPLGGVDGGLVVTHTTSSSITACLPELLAAVGAGAHVVSSCEELSYPGCAHRDRGRARRRGPGGRRRGGGTGRDPGFAIDYLTVVPRRACAKPACDSEHVRHVQDAGCDARRSRPRSGPASPAGS